MTSLLQDLRYALRIFRSKPGFTVMVIATLGLGIGASTAVFTLVEAVLLRPLPYPHAEQLLQLSERSRQTASIPVAYPNFLDWRKQNTAFRNMSALAHMQVTLGSQAGARRVDANFVSASFFDVLDVRPAMGRSFLPSDDQAGAPLAAVVTRGFWMREMNGSRTAVGTTLQLNRRPCTVVGVLPAGFRFYQEGDIFVPMEAALGRALADRGNHSEMVVLARLREGVTLEQARAQIGTIAHRLEAQYPATNSGIGASLVTLREHLSGSSRATLLVLWAAVCLVLLIACANVANLLLARSGERSRELAIRTAMGAGHARLIRQLLVESTVLALSGAALGLLPAVWSLRAVAFLLPGGFDAADLRIDAPVLLYSLAAALVCALLFGLAPASRSVRSGISESLKEGERAGVSRERGRMRDLLIVGEVAVSITLLAGAGLLGRSMYQLLHVNPGFDTSHLIAVQINVPFPLNLDFGRTQAFFSDVLDRSRALPGVDGAAVATNFALLGGTSSVEVYRDDRPVPARGHFPSIPYQVVSPGYFRTVGIPLRQGRFFDSRDSGPSVPPGTDPEKAFALLSQAPLSAVVNETMARELWPGEDPVGRRFRFGTPEMHGPALTVAGVAGDTRQEGLETAPRAGWYFCSTQFPLINGSTHVLLRSSRPAEALGTEVRRVVAGIDPQIPVSGAKSFEEVRDGVLEGRAARAILMGAAAALALLLALAGLYSVISYSVAQRRHEFGVRMALGADSPDLVRMVLRQSIGRVLAGIALGLGGAAALTRVLSGMLFEVRPGDPLTLAAATLLVLLTAMAATYVPARRASGISPITALRCE